MSAGFQAHITVPGFSGGTCDPSCRKSSRKHAVPSACPLMFLTVGVEDTDFHGALPTLKLTMEPRRTLRPLLTSVCLLPPFPEFCFLVLFFETESYYILLALSGPELSV